VQQHIGPRVDDEPVPDALERLGVVGDAGARAVGVGPLEGGILVAQPRHHLVGDARDHLVGSRAGRVEGVERVQDARRDAAQEAEAIDEQGPGARPRCGDRGDRSGGPGTDHDDVIGRAHMCEDILI
jgi:hypothetical protein